jgi:Alpha/beta hydrolase domain
MVCHPALLSGLIALALATPANAEVTRFKVLERTASALQGRGFGAAGQVEKITASATIALDPANPRNAVIADLDRAPRNADGKVEATSDVVILRPAYPNGILLFEIPNRGRRLISAWFDNSSIQGSVRLDQADDAGRGFLLSQGYSLVWAGWQADAPAGAGLLSIQVPVVAGITGPVRQEWSFGDTTNPHRAALSYPVADRASAQLSVRARADDLRQNPPELKFSFIDDMMIEIWGSEASLLVTDTRGRNLEPPPEVRLYMVAGSPHGNVANAVVTRRASCTLPLNPVYGGPAFRALLTDLRAWITEGVPPPASRYPTLAQNTLVAAGDVYPVPIPDLGYRVQYARAEAIEQATPLPKIRGEYPLYLPRAGADGNALAGVRLPLLAAPRATYTGWNPIAGADGGQTLCTQMGATLPFAGTRAERIATADPRPSIEELYPTSDAYVAAVKAATARLVDERLLLPEDAAEAIAAAEAGTLARLAP